MSEARLAVEIDAKPAEAGGRAAVRTLDEIRRAARGATNELDQTTSRWDRFKDSVFSMRGALTSLGIGAAIRSITANIAEAEAANAQLEAAIRSTGGAAGVTAEQVRLMAAELQRTTTVSDDAVVSMSAVLMQYDRVGRDTFPRASAAIVDMSVRLGTDLQSAAVQVGKALQDPIEGVSMLSRAGIIFSDAQKKVLKDLVDTGQQAKAQALILDELERKFGGAGVAARNTLGGALAGLKNSFSDLLEGKGSAPELTGAINDLTTTLNDPATKQGFDSLISGLTQIVGLLAKGAGLFGNFSKGLGETLAAGVSGAGGKSIEEQLQILRDEQARLTVPTLNFGPGMPHFGTAITDLARWEAIQREMDVLESVLRDAGPNTAGGAVVPAAASGSVTPTGLTDDQRKALEETKRIADAARETLRGMVDDLDLQAVAFGNSAVESLRYRLTLGDLADEVSRLGPEGEALKNELLELTDSLSKSEAAVKLQETLRAGSEQVTQQVLSNIDLARLKGDELVAAQQNQATILTATEMERYNIQRQILLDAMANGVGDITVHQATLEEMERQHQARMAAIRQNAMTIDQKFTEMAAKQKTQTVLGQMVQMTAGVAQHSRAMFEVNKAAAIAQAVMNIPEAASNAYVFGSRVGGPIVGAAFAALAVAAQAAQLSAIKSTSFSGGGGGTTPSSAGSIPVINGNPVSHSATPPGGQTAPSASGTIVITGIPDRHSFSHSEVRDIMQQVFEQRADGAVDGAVVVVRP